MSYTKMPHIAVLCGGPSLERGISLNSARCFLDHARSLSVSLSLFYLHPTGLFYELSPAELYSNTPADFDFKLAGQREGLDEALWLERLKEIDLLFPLIHGAYGEDGTLQAKLEAKKIPFVGSSSAVCARMFHKHRAQKWLSENGFLVSPALYIDSLSTPIAPFWAAHSLERAVIKPAMSGSSIGVALVHSAKEALEEAKRLWAKGFREFLLEPYSEDVEFTICTLSHRGTPVALIPSEIEMQKPGIFDYRKKYLPSLEARTYCPPRFTASLIAAIRSQAERLFCLFGMQDYARLDGWVSKEGTIRFSDFNPISGMEQNSFLFQQASRVGLSHTDLIERILSSALHRYGQSLVTQKSEASPAKRPLYVLMGGDTSERQVSLLSGTNVWLKLLQSSTYAPTPFLLDTKQNVWELPYHLALHHTVEEMAQHCEEAGRSAERMLPLLEEIRKKMALPLEKRKKAPRKEGLASFLARAKRAKAFVFLALHGGIGENGSLQKRLERRALSFNGSSSRTSRLCMDKGLTARTVRSLCNPDILSMPQISFRIEVGATTLWNQAVKKFRTAELLVKPRKDGCSTGVVRLQSSEEFSRYVELCRTHQMQAPPGTFMHHSFPVEMPGLEQKEFLLEPFIETDLVSVCDKALHYQRKSGWCEMTIGVWEQKGNYRAFNPSLTIAAGQVLSVEEKFQGGTGINITPPPESILPFSAKEKMQRSACKVAAALGIRGYCRLDLFVECESGVIRVIEANTLPALSPSTVLYHQALAETPPIPPQELLELFVTQSDIT